MNASAGTKHNREVEPKHKMCVREIYIPAVQNYNRTILIVSSAVWMHVPELNTSLKSECVLEEHIFLLYIILIVFEQTAGKAFYNGKMMSLESITTPICTVYAREEKHFDIFTTLEGVV